MTITADLIAVRSLAVGNPGTAYPCTRFDRTIRVVGPEQTGGFAYRHETWQARCHAAAANVAAVAPLWETIRGHFVSRGQRVTLATWTITLILPEDGAPVDTEERSIAGYPTVAITPLDELSYGTWLSFDVQAETMVAVVAEDDLVEHDYTVEEEEDEDGLVTLTQRGRLRVVNGGSARDYLDDNIVDAARTAASGAGQGFRVRYTQGLDAALVEYQFVAAPFSGGGSGVTSATSVDRTQRSNDGTIRRTVRGNAKGPGAASYAASQEPAPLDNEIFTRKDVSDPSVPDGRVDFTYELAVGVEDAGFPGIYIFRIQESIAEVAGGRDLVAAQYFSGAPILRNGLEREYIYVQTTTVEFLGADADHGIVPLLDEELIVGRPRLSRPVSPLGVNAVSITYTYASDAPVDPLPSVTKVDPFA